VLISSGEIRQQVHKTGDIEARKRQGGWICGSYAVDTVRDLVREGGPVTQWASFDGSTLDNWHQHASAQFACFT
jgi:hypothetical protein